MRYFLLLVFAISCFQSYSCICYYTFLEEYNAAAILADYEKYDYVFTAKYDGERTDSTYIFEIIECFKGDCGQELEGMAGTAELCEDSPHSNGIYMIYAWDVQRVHERIGSTFTVDGEFIDYSYCDLSRQIFPQKASMLNRPRNWDELPEKDQEKWIEEDKLRLKAFLSKELTLLRNLKDFTDLENQTESKNPVTSTSIPLSLIAFAISILALLISLFKRR